MYGETSGSSSERMSILLRRRLMHTSSIFEVSLPGDAVMPTHLVLFGQNCATLT